MPAEKTKAPPGRGAIKVTESHYLGEETMTSTSISHLANLSNTPLTYSPRVTVDARFAGGTITLEPEHVDWIDDTVVLLEIPGSGPLMLRPFEARDLADALLAVARLADGGTAAPEHDTEVVELHRRTQPGSPAFEEMI